MVLETGNTKKRKLFSLILSHHRIWGPLLLPYIITDETGRGFYRLVEPLSPFPATDTMGMLTQEERDVVKIINEYTDRALFKLFSKDKNVKDFLEKVTPEKLEEFIRPYIERRIYKALTIARNENIPVYSREKTATVHSDDILDLSEDNAITVFRFIRTEEQTTYSLGLESGGNKIDLLGCSSEIITMSPCIVRHDNRVLFVQDIDGSKIKPFLTKEHIIVPKKTEVQYFKTFVLNAVNNFKVEGTGFEIRHIEPVKESLLDIEHGIQGKPVMILRYNYEGIKIYSNEPSSGFTVFIKEGNNFIFNKFQRDFSWEKKCRDTLGELGFFSDDEVNFYPLGEDGAEPDLYSLIEAVSNSFEDLKKAGFNIKSRLERNYNLAPVSLEMSSELINDWFDLKAMVKIGPFLIPFSRFRKNILNDIREFILPDNSVFILPEAWFTRYKNLFDLGKTTGDNIKIHKQHFSLLTDTLSEKHSESEKLRKLLEPREIPYVEKPAGLDCELRSYQAEGLNWLLFLQNSGLGGCLADDMGLGKTIQTLALLQHNAENLSPSVPNMLEGQLNLFGGTTESSRLTSLLVVPASLVYNWENEVKRFAPGLRVCSYKGNLRKKSSSYFNEFDIILSTYHTVRQDIEIFSRFRFHYIILDESQVIKNPASMLYKTVTRLNSEFKLVLTGTPVENSLTDLWTQLNFVNPGLLGDLTFFRREFAGPIEKQGDDEKESRLRKIIQPFILRRTKEMVARDLPPVSEQTVYCDMTDDQERLYEEEKSAVRNSILSNVAAAGLEKSAIVVLQGLMKLRQISNHPLMAFEEYSSGSGKFETVIQDIDSVVSEGHKILVFSSFVRHLELFAAELDRKRIGYAMLTGASTGRDRIVDSFQNDPSKMIFLISLKAGGVGLNLTAADYVFILDPWWNPASEMQALSRAHRIGQDKSVFVYRYITGNTIEEKISRLQQKKSRLADTFISSNNPLKDINIDEILDIIG